MSSLTRDLLKRAMELPAQLLFGGVGCILVLHRVLPESKRSRFPENRSLELTPESLGEILRESQALGLEPIPLDHVQARLGQRHSRRFIVFTFDDGYLDNLEHALPVFREFRIPFTVFAATGLISAEHPAWWYALERLVTESSSASLSLNGEAMRWTWSTDSERNRAIESLGKVIREQTIESRDPLLRQLFSGTNIDPWAHTRQMMMNWDQLRQLAADPLVTIGAHTRGHFSLGHLGEEAALDELRSAREALKVELQREILHLAFPFGGPAAIRQREVALAAQAGFATAVTTRCANVFAAHAAHLHALPRLGISGNYPAASRFRAMASGLVTARERNWRPGVVTL